MVTRFPPSARYRITFAKFGEMRWISHRDLLRVWERTLRRAGLELAMSQGFHPKPRMSFPLALALGLESAGEIMEVHLIQHHPSDWVRTQLQSQLPTGIQIQSLEALPARTPKAAAERVRYQMRIPAERAPQALAAIRGLESAPAIVGSEASPGPPRHVTSGLTQLWCDGEIVVFEQQLSESVGVGPRDVLAAIGLADLEASGHCLVRTEICLSAASASPTFSETPGPSGGSHPTNPSCNSQGTTLI